MAMPSPLNASAVVQDVTALLERERSRARAAERAAAKSAREAAKWRARAEAYGRAVGDCACCSAALRALDEDDAEGV
jgi:hypothetical protein